MEGMFSDQKVYKECKVNPISKVRKNISEILTNLNNNKYLHRNFHKNELTMTDKDLPRGYGLPKIHKPGLSFRPIISSVNSPNQTLSKLLLSQLTKFITPPTNSITNSISFLNKINHLHIPTDYVLFSLDVVSLFTNVSKDLVMDSLFRRFHVIHRSSKIPFEKILSCVETLFDNTYFSFNGKYNNQIYGTPMGSPISPFFADIVMQDLELSCLKELNEKHGVEVLFYYRYVDDLIFCANRKHVDLVLSTFNGYDDRINFTHELETTEGINFLDMNLQIVNSKIKTDWYNKDLSSGRFINFNSNHPQKLKINMIYNITDRVIFNSHPDFHENNIKKIEHLLRQNSFPPKFYQKYVKKRLRKIKNITPNVPPMDIAPRPVTVGFPFINESVYSEFRKLLNKFDINISSKNKQ